MLRATLTVLLVVALATAGVVSAASAAAVPLDVSTHNKLTTQPPANGDSSRLGTSKRSASTRTELARTGFDFVPIAAAGLLLLAVGLGVRRLAPRRGSV